MQGKTKLWWMWPGKYRYLGMISVSAKISVLAWQKYWYRQKYWLRENIGIGSIHIGLTLYGRHKYHIMTMFYKGWKQMFTTSTLDNSTKQQSLSQNTRSWTFIFLPFIHPISSWKTFMKLCLNLFLILYILFLRFQTLLTKYSLNFLFGLSCSWNFIVKYLNILNIKYGSNTLIWIYYFIIQLSTDREIRYFINMYQQYFHSNECTFLNKKENKGEKKEKSYHWTFCTLVKLWGNFGITYEYGFTKKLKKIIKFLLSKMFFRQK
jgi:hypothetical protein